MKFRIPNVECRIPPERRGISPFSEANSQFTIRNS